MHDEIILQKPSIMLRGNNHSRGTLFPGVGATGGGGGGKSIRIKQQQRYKKWIKKRRVRVILLLVVLLSACSFFLNNAFHGILNRQNDENEKSMRKVNSHYAKVDRHSRRERKQMQREDHLSKIFGLIIEEDDLENNKDSSSSSLKADFRGGGSEQQQRKSLSQLAFGQYQMQQKRLFPGEGIKVFRERIFDPLLHGLEYAHMGTIIANSGENGKGISVAFQTAPDIEGGFDQTVRVMTKKNGKTTKSTFVVYNETEDGGLGSSSGSNSSSNRRKLADTAWVLEKPLPAPAVGEKSAATKIGGETLQPRTYSNGLWAPVLHRDEKTKTEYLFYAETPPRCLRPRILAQEFPIVRKAIPKRWIIGGDIKVRTRSFADGSGTEDENGNDDGVGDLKEWSKAKTVYRMTTDNVAIPKVIANKLTVVTLDNAEEVWLLPFWRQRSPHTCSTARGVRNAAGVLRSTDKGETWKANGAIQFQTGAKGRWVIEGSIFESGESHHLTMLMRSTEGVAFKSISSDLGVTWSAPLPSALVNPDSKLNTIVNRKTKRLYVAFNDETIAMTASEGGADAIKGTSEDKEQTAGGKKRDELVIAHSDDEGENLYIFARIDEGVTPPGVMIHYPTMAFYDDQELFVTYSISYNNATNFVEKPRRDGIWLARMTPPKTIDETKPRRSLKTILLDNGVGSSSNSAL